MIQTDLIINNLEIKFIANDKYDGKQPVDTNNMEVNTLFHSQFENKYKKDFIIDYWTSKLSNDKFTIDSITAIDTKKYLDNVLSGIHNNIDLTKIISFFDYLKDSKNKSEEELGNSLYNIVEEIINLSISKGKLSHVSRIDLKPIIKIGKNEISLDKLSSGNLYLIQRLTSLLS